MEIGEELPPFPKPASCRPGHRNNFGQARFSLLACAEIYELGKQCRRRAAAPSDFIRDIVAAHVAEKKYPRIHTRFPPEPNGYLHIGHAKSICLNFGIAREFGGICNLRMDDTNPTKEDIEYVDSIQEDVNWLIGGWADDRLGLKPKGKTPDDDRATANAISTCRPFRHVRGGTQNVRRQAGAVLRQ